MIHNSNANYATQPLNVIECPEFRALLLLCCEEFRDTDIPHRTSIRKQILKAWELHFQQLKKKLAIEFSMYITLSNRLTDMLLQNALGKISHTVDIWSDQNLQLWLVITAHYVHRDSHTRELSLEADIIAFHHVVRDHGGENIGALFEKLLDRVGIASKVCIVLTHCVCSADYIDASQDIGP